MCLCVSLCAYSLHFGACMRESVKCDFQIDIHGISTPSAHVRISQQQEKFRFGIGWCPVMSLAKCKALKSVQIHPLVVILEKSAKVLQQ